MLSNPTLKPTNAAGDYYYEMYEMVSLKDAEFAAFGNITFGKNAKGELITMWSNAHWTKCKLPD